MKRRADDSQIAPRRANLDPSAALDKVSREIGPRCRGLVRSLSREMSASASAGLDVQALSAAAASPTASAAAAAGGRRSDHRLIQRATLGWNLVEQQRFDALGREEWLDQQLHPESIDDGGLEDLLVSALPTIAMSPLEIALTHGDQLEIPFFELEIAILLRSIYSPRQLHERMTVFWSDHFSIDIGSDFGIFFKPTDDREAIRPNVFGRFRHLLGASAHSPAMLDYLTNDTNVAGHPNENYSRELMELHTLGVDGGYTQEDVREVARCFTGWGYHREGFQFGRFRFHRPSHDEGPKTVLGRPIPAGGGAADVEDVLDLLASHPAAGRFLGAKLLRYLRGYQPRVDEIDRMAAVYSDTGGDLRALTREALSSPELDAADPKLKRPYHLVVSAVRAVLAEVENPFPLLLALLTAGHLPFTWHPPNGFPDSFGYWSGSLLPRWNFASTVLSGLVPRLPLGAPSTPRGLLRLLAGSVLHDQVGKESIAAAGDFAAAGPLSPDRRAEVLGLVIGSPEFQYY